MQDMDYGPTSGIFNQEHDQGDELAGEGGMPDETQTQEEEKPKRRRRKSEEESPQAVSDDEQLGDSAGPTDEHTGFGDEGQEPDESDFPPEADDDVASPQRRERGLDGYGRVIYDQSDGAQHDLSMLTGARNARRILTATIDGIDTDGDSLPRVIFYVGTVKVLIPFAEMGMDLNPAEIEPGRAAGIIDSMLGAKIDYMVRGVDIRNRLAGASRREAMLLRRRTILNARQGDDFRIKLGTIATARVLQVYRASMLVEVYGYQTYIRRNAASNLWVNDIREFADVGEEKPVEVVELERDPGTGEVVHLAVSIRGVENTPQIELRTGNTYTGRITGFSDTAYFVRVAGVPLDVRCPINSNNVMDTLRADDYVKFVVRGVYDGRPTGSIRKIIKKAAPGMW
ncbi:MAG: hypothetical protein FWE32_07590 [Oscillospiraceae bacterium]|nr:hypothetical protein [Oscillospiraceae bacterium]